MFRKLSKLMLIACLLMLSGCDRDFNYIDALKALRGTSYWTLQCSAYITAAKRFPHHCGASGFWKDGCGGALVEVAELDSYNQINQHQLMPGDVIAFHGVHVAAYVGDGKFMDSDPNHYGVGDMTPDAIHGDTWFVGKVKILRWRS